MKIPPFELERYFAQHEFTAPHPMCLSDCESLKVNDLLEWEPGALEKLKDLWLGYTESQGGPELRKTIASLYQSMTPDEILVHAGAEEPIFNFMNVTLEPGDHVIVHCPCYQSLIQIPQSLGCEVTRWEADASSDWTLDVDFLKKNLRPTTKAVVINLPHNPTGYLMTKQDFKQVTELFKGHGAILFVDEVYRGLEYDPNDQLPAVCDVLENAVSLGVMSKAFGLAGLRIGWIATRNKTVYNSMAKFKDFTTICNSAPSEFLATLALRQRDKILSRNLEVISTNLSLLDIFFESRKESLSWSRPKAGCIAFPQLRGGEADCFCERTLKKSGVLLAPSSKFQFGDSHFRIGFGRKNLPEVLRRLGEFC